jgi:opacity protein-like surface antigen
MRKILRRAAWFAAAAAVCGGTVRAQEAFWRRLEYGLLAGFSFTRTDARSGYRDAWSHELLTSVIEETIVSPETGLAFSIRAQAAYFLGPGLGLLAELGFAAAAVPSKATHALEYTWKNGDRGNLAGEWPGTGRLRSAPLALNAVWRHRGRGFSISASAGPAVFFNSFRASARAGLGISEAAFIRTDTGSGWTQTVDQHLDAVAAEIEIPIRRWTSVGFNAGLGADIGLSDRLTATVDFRFYHCRAKDVRWDWVSGTYPGRVEAGSSWEVTEDLARYAEGRMAAFHVDPSYFQIAAGFKIRLKER